MMRYRPATPADYPALVRIAAENARGTAAAERGEGFLTGRFDTAKFAAFDAELGILVAEEEGAVAGFLCATTVGFGERAPIIRAMLDAAASAELEAEPIGNRRLFCYGPVCVAGPWRGRGVLKGLYEALKRGLAERFDIGVLFIDAGNPHSLAAHERGLGMHPVAVFAFGGRDYAVLAFHCRAAG